MNTYYVCDPTIAKQCCNGIEAIDVQISLWTGTVFGNLLSSPLPNAKRMVLIKNISDEIKVLLTLCDKEFREIESDFFEFNPRYYEWKVL